MNVKAVIFAAGIAAWLSMAAAQSAEKPICQTDKVLIVPRGAGAVEVGEFVTNRGGPVEAETAARVRWDAAGLTVVFDCSDDEIVAVERRRDEDNLWADDCVEVFLDVGHTHDLQSRWVHVILSAAGSVFDERGPATFWTSGEVKSGDVAYDVAVLDAHVEETERGWRAIITLPWGAIGGEPNVGDAWGVNLCRTERPKGEYVCWSPTWGPYHDIHQWGHIIFADEAGNAREALKGVEEIHAMRIDRTEKRQEYMERVTRGEGFVPWQSREPVSPAEQEFRRMMEQRKDEMLARRLPVRHPVMVSKEDIARAHQNIEQTEWGKEWFRQIISMADYIVGQPEGYIEAMLPELTPTNTYGFTCPNCVGTRSQEGMGLSMMKWDYRNPEVIACKMCGQTYPDPKFPETGVLVCPRAGQTFTYYLNEAERNNPEDRSGALAWKWVSRPIHVSFSGIVRHQKIAFMISSLKSLSYAHLLTGEARYAQAVASILERLAHNYRKWLYHDYWDTFADCDPLYAAWHERNLPLEWKRNASSDAYKNDTVDNAAMLQGYWGAGRIHPSTDAISYLATICRAYDLTRDARREDGQLVWTPELQEHVERNLILEYLMGAEPFAGGPGMATATNNKAPRIYHAMAAVATALGLPEFADTALRGYDAIRDSAFLFDAFSHESPAYTNMYLAELLLVPETLHGFRWPENFGPRQGVVDVYGTDPKLRAVMMATVDQLRPDACYLPLSDTLVSSAPSAQIFEIGLKRYPDFFSGKMPALYRGRLPTGYAVLNLSGEEIEQDAGLDLSEVFFPAWMTAILRHGSGPSGTVLAMPLNPPGNHRHADNLSLYYYDRGHAVLGELGYVGDSAMLGWGHTTLGVST